MVILNLKIDNIYLFNKFELDFTFKRKLKQSTIGLESLRNAPKINYKRLNIIMGANASGKTTLGKLLCTTQNLLCGRALNLLDKINNKKEAAELSVRFVIENYLFEYVIRIDGDIINEKLKYVKLYKSYSLAKAYEILNEKEFMEESFEISKNRSNDIPIFSKICDQNFDEINGNIKYKEYFYFSMPFYYRFASFTDKSDVEKEIDNDLLVKIGRNIKIIDDSILEVRSAFSKTLDSAEEEQQQDFYIVFKNGDKLLVPDGNIKEIKGNRLSQGTIESVELAYIINDFNKYAGTIYLDEQMAYMHTRLSNEMIIKLLDKLNGITKEMQLFITTHNENALDLNVPIHSFLFFVRNENGICVVHPEETLKKNDRNLIEYVQNNYFDTNPELNGFWED